ncbi:hypothetical protein VBK27_22945, partial [Enterobacter hormaechei]|nr:hypothetical protein [Enterobacter hormaechei]MEA3625791.1 hypothetical protein [Enterobacter hormaechei]MEA3661688.1 hypothetical protein [Enterobacter hormaechei]MEA3759458.1 hypothetical protein [Enterobacter hormaechei]MEA3792159.1 hypothetical protein [Enterobacter hormaechei]
KRAYCLKTQPATGETYPKSDLFNKASGPLKRQQQDPDNYWDDCWNPGGLSARYYGFISRQ